MTNLDDCEAMEVAAGVYMACSDIFDERLANLLRNTGQCYDD
jgi:hypothetical protein